jgi:hypothetical protein
MREILTTRQLYQLLACCFVLTRPPQRTCRLPRRCISPWCSVDSARLWLAAALRTGTSCPPTCWGTGTNLLKDPIIIIGTRNMDRGKVKVKWPLYLSTMLWRRAGGTEANILDLRSITVWRLNYRETCSRYSAYKQDWSHSRKWRLLRTYWIFQLISRDNKGLIRSIGFRVRPMSRRKLHGSHNVRHFRQYCQVKDLTGRYRNWRCCSN